ncbi:MAG: hypothetical protein HC880_15790 [Bacteroidia bacterium]|nr:hypothetical protein [Bacteroidia bacterium]
MKANIKNYEQELTELSQARASPSADLPMSKTEILDLINQDLDQALDKLNTRFLGKNAVYGDLLNEYISRPNNFSLATFRSRLRVFVSMNL